VAAIFIKSFWKTKKMPEISGLAVEGMAISAIWLKPWQKE